ncbi:hypothetical protein F2Q68_00030036 [Brassica cretica]|uniref:Uncharacterized protein n=1 Tax=Brassica cretica TaxID=69181 RepID=A0A8S9GG41_BRACR|nr:hypothetical protein F2Q68_00030036 [Brassica cretica]
MQYTVSRELPHHRVFMTLFRSQDQVMVSERGKHLEERFIYFRWSLDECPAEGPKKGKKRQLASCFSICTMLSFPSHETVSSQL